VTTEFITPDWRVPANVRALMTTRALGDVKDEAVRRRLRAELPADPCWLKQVHGTNVIDAAGYRGPVDADASFARTKSVVCAVMAADCMPVLLAEEKGEAVAAAHAGWRGLSAGVIEATVAAMGLAPSRLLAWLGPAIGPQAYEIGAEVREAFLTKDSGAASAFVPTRPGHWNADLYALARRRLAAIGVTRVAGGGYCTATEAGRFHSWRRDRSAQRMAALVWLA
jgi:YfiH family protein